MNGGVGIWLGVRPCWSCKMARAGKHGCLKYDVVNGGKGIVEALEYLDMCML